MTGTERIAEVFSDAVEMREEGFALEVNGQAWTAATDGHMLLAIHGGEPIAELSERQRAIRGFIESWVSDAGHRTTVEELSAFAGEAQRRRLGTCRDCSGSQLRTCQACGVSCECKCESCEDGKRWTSVAAREGVVLAQLVDLNRLAKLLIGATGEVRVQSNLNDRLVVLNGDGWMALLMGLGFSTTVGWAEKTWPARDRAA